MATGSWRDCEHRLDLGNRFAVLEAIGKHAQRKDLHAGNGFVLGMAVGQDTWKDWQFCNPAAVVFTIKFDNEIGECHVTHYIPWRVAPTKARQPWKLPGT